MCQMWQGCVTRDQGMCHPSPVRQPRVLCDGSLDRCVSRSHCQVPPDWALRGHRDAPGSPSEAHLVTDSISYPCLNWKSLDRARLESCFSAFHIASGLSQCSQMIPEMTQNIMDMVDEWLLWNNWNMQTRENEETRRKVRDIMYYMCIRSNTVHNYILKFFLTFWLPKCV